MAGARIIKRYSNRKLYDTETKRYVTLDEINALVKSGQDVKVLDNATSEDLTNVTLSQILLEKEKHHKDAMPKAFFTGVLQSGAKIRDALLSRADAVLGDRLDDLVRALRLPSRREFEAIEKRIAALESKLTAALARKPRAKV